GEVPGRPTRDAQGGAGRRQAPEGWHPGRRAPRAQHEPPGRGSEATVAGRFPQRAALRGAAGREADAGGRPRGRHHPRLPRPVVRHAGVTRQESGGAIVRCDSLQVYRGLDIGSAKATPAERAAVPHHMLDVADPDEPFSAAEYSRQARAALAAITGRGRLAVVAGGTGLYLRALLHGLFEGPSRDEALRGRLERIALRRGDSSLHRMLAAVDPEAAARIAPRDRLRVVRALEVFRATRRPLSEHHRAGADPLRGHDVLVVGLDPPRDAL